MFKNLIRTFVLFSMIILFMGSIIDNTIYASVQDLSTNTAISSSTTSDSSKDSNTKAVTNDSSSKDSASSSSTIHKDDNSKDTSISKEKKEEIIDYGWKIIDNKKYYIVNNKILETTGWFMEKDVNPNIKTKDKNYDYKYYLDKDFSVVVGWKEIDLIWYYFDSEGIRQNGWIDNNGLYYLNDSGEMKIGWNKIGTDTFYFNQYGQATIGKNLIDSKWYFFDEQGRLQKGFYEHNGKTFYSDQYGVMVTNQWIKKARHNFYIKADSSIATGDLFLNGIMEKFDENGYSIGYDSTAKNDMFVQFLNVGNADCEFIKLPSGETVLIDTGDTTTTKTLINFLNSQNLKTEFFVANPNGQASNDNIMKNDNNINITTSSSVRANNTGKPVIDYVVLTHPHSDHIGGVIELLKHFNVGRFIIPKYFEMKDYTSGATSISQNNIDIIKYDYKIYKATMDVLLQSGVPIVQAKPNSFIDSEHILQFLHLDKDYSKLDSDTFYSEYSSFNDNSAIVYLNYHDFQCLFSADIQWKAENDFSTRNALKGNEVDILKVPHHGNVGSSSYTFVGYVNPAVGIITRTKDRIVTTNEPYDVLTTCGVNIYETSLTDGVSVYVTKDNWNIETK